jgi:hypothetical protein
MLNSPPKQETAHGARPTIPGKDMGPLRTWPPSDHFDGKRFFNPTLPKDSTPSRLSTLKTLREPRSQWPAWVENKGMPRLNETLGANQVAITFVNHATFLIQTGGISILTDPVWSERASPFRWIGPTRVRKPGVAFEDLPAIDIILLSHNHDHLTSRADTASQRFAPTVPPPPHARIFPRLLIRRCGADWWTGFHSTMR